MYIRERKYESGRVGYQLDFGLVNGKRKQVAYKTRAEAVRAMKKALKDRKRHGELGHLLTPAEVAEYTTARKRLNGTPLMVAVEYYLANAQIVREPILLTELNKRFMDAKALLRRGERYGETELVLRAFALTVPGKHAHEVKAEDVERWLHGNAWKRKTQLGYRAAVSAVFRWGMMRQRGHVAENPCAHVEVSGEQGAEEVEVLTIEEVAVLLAKVQEERHRRLMAFVVLGLFCGIRPEELRRLRWDRVDIEGGTVIVEAKKAKTRQRRVVDLSDNAKAWLRLCVKAGQEMIVPLNFTDRWADFRVASGWTPTGSGGEHDWPHDGMRHTYASMHYAHHQDEAKLQVQMGHKSKEELHKHYRAVKTKAEAAKFWALMPPGK